MSLSRRHIELLRVHATAALAAALVQAKYYRERPDEAARVTALHVAAHIAVNRANGRNKVAAR